MTRRMVLAMVAVLVGALSVGLPTAGSAALGTQYAMEVLDGPNPLMKSTGMVIYRDDDEHFLYSADTLRNTIFRVDLRPDTRPEARITRITHDFEPAGSVLISPHTLEFEDGFLYVTEWATNSVRRVSRDGAIRQIIAGPGPQPVGLGPGKTFTDKDTGREVTTGTTGIAFNSNRQLFVGHSTHDTQFSGGLWKVDPHGVEPAEEIARGPWMVEDISFAPETPTTPMSPTCTAAGLSS
ncbi:MAG: hypothetical protein M3O70_07465 [Actinomycetota bacterium]|nr:hypothetical protein [Actinomycetota bacterium]